MNLAVIIGTIYDVQDIVYNIATKIKKILTLNLIYFCYKLLQYIITYIL